jgi:hypothetical protein
MKFQKGHKINLGKKNHLGFKHSEETKKIIGLIHKGNKYSVGKIRSKETRRKISQTLKLRGIEPTIKFIGIGKNHWAWKEDRTKLKRFNETSKDRRSYAYIEWRKRVYERDNYKCKILNGDCSAPHSRIYKTSRTKI